MKKQSSKLVAPETSLEKPAQTNQSVLVNNFDLNDIPNSSQFSNAKVEKRFSLMKTLVLACCLIIGICVGIIFAYLLIYFI